MRSQQTTGARLLDAYFAFRPFLPTKSQRKECLEAYSDNCLYKRYCNTVNIDPLVNVIAISTQFGRHELFLSE